MVSKIDFINDWKSGSYSVSDLCVSYGISRDVGHKYIRRFLASGYGGLEELSRAPHHIPFKTDPEIEKAICDFRRNKRRAGIKQILRHLRNEFDPERLPAHSTGNLILKRNGLILPRQKRRRVEPVKPIFDPKAPNEIWSADFKGKFRMGNRIYCSPLTIADSYSRYVFSAKGMYYATYRNSRVEFERVFREHGLPLQIHTDNGPPFGCVQSLHRLTRLSVWFIELGIEPVYSDPGHPEQNGRHERMHRELKGESTRPPGFDLNAQQRKLNEFVREYNEERYHQALGMETPASVHKKSERMYPEEIEKWEYDKDYEEKYVCRNGAIRWGHSDWVGVSTALAEKTVGLLNHGGGMWEVYFRNKRLGSFDEKKLRIQDDEGRFKRNLV
jgi:transposase InsO family protein